MSPLPADAGPFVARARTSVPATPSSAGSEGIAPPYVAGAATREEQGRAISASEGAPTVFRSESPVANATDLPWISESVSALYGLDASGDELIGYGGADVSQPAARLPDVEEPEPAEQWDDELGTFPLSEELPELLTEDANASGWEQDRVSSSESGRDEGAWPSSGEPAVPAPVPSSAVEGVAQRLERIARTLRERGATGPLEEDGSDPLGALITGYVLGMSGVGKGKE
jgi:hypothetical protein